MQRILKVILISLMAVPLIALGADPAPTVKQVTRDTVIVSWNSPQPGSSQVEYASPNLFVSETTPEYATNTTHHQMKIIGLDVGVPYTFIGHATTDNGQTMLTDPVSFTLQQVVADEMQPLPAESTNSLPFNIVNILLLPFKKMHSWRLSLVSQLSDARTYALSQKGSLVFVALGGLLYGLIFLFEEASFTLIFDWLLGLFAWQIWRERRVTHGFKIRDGVTHKALPGAQVAVLNKINYSPYSTYTSDVTGYIAFTWPTDEGVVVRVTRRGYQSTTQTFNREVTDIMLTPLSALVKAPGVLPINVSFQLRHSLKLIEAVILGIGSFLLIISAFLGFTVLHLLTLLIYVYLWLLYLTYKPRRYHVGQVVDTLTQAPVAKAHLVFYRNNKAENAMSDASGLVYISYPFPDLISLAKPGYVEVLRQTVPMTAITSEPVLFSLQPKE